MEIVTNFRYLIREFRLLETGLVCGRKKPISGLGDAVIQDPLTILPQMQGARRSYGLIRDTIKQNLLAQIDIMGN
jgi:hypothetical protein